MAKVGDASLEKRISAIPATLSLQFEVPKLKKMIKVNMNTRSTIKQHLPLFTSKFDSDFSSFKIVARVKYRAKKVEVPTDVPIRYIIGYLG
jgi:hypothetical protein